MPKQYIVVYRPHGRLKIETQFFGPFTEWLDADDFADTLPFLGIYEGSGNKGVKYIQELICPEVKHAA